MTVRADTVGPVKSVKFDVNQGLYTKVENAVPYALYGDSNGNYSGTTFYPGVYETEISAYSNSNAEGTLLVNQDYQTIIVSSSYKPRLRSVYNGRCIDDNDDWGSPSEALKQTTCSSSDSSQKFRIKPVPGQKDVVNLVNVETGRCLDITGASTANGAAVIQWSCHGGTNQQFRLKGVDNSVFHLIAVHSAKCVTAETDYFRTGFIQKSCNADDTAQQWRLY
ncbi:MAG: RICIN domain-containing protein [Caldilineaceae bacterium]